MAKMPYKHQRKKGPSPPASASGKMEPESSVRNDQRRRELPVLADTAKAADRTT